MLPEQKSSLIILGNTAALRPYSKPLIPILFGLRSDYELMIRPRPTHQKEHRTGRPTAPARGVRGGVAAGKHRLVRGTESTPGREEGHASPGSALRLHSRRQRALSEQARNETHSHDTTEGEKARKCCVKNPQVFFLSFKAKSNL